MKVIKLVRYVLLIGLIAVVPMRAAFAEQVVTDAFGNTLRLQEGDVDSGDIKIHYYTIGNGPLLLISHGNGDFWGGWAHQLHMLSQRYKVVLYDVRNFGKSGKKTGIANNRNSVYEKDLLALQNHFTKDPAVHIGNDLGGMVLWMYAMNYPEKVKLLIQMNAIHPRAFIRELAFGEQAKMSWYIQHMIETGKMPNMSAEGGDTQGKGSDKPSTEGMGIYAGDTPSIAKLRAESSKNQTEEGRQGVVDWYRANFPAKPYTPGSNAFGSRGVEFPHIKAPTLTIAALSDVALHPAGYNDLGQWVDNSFTLVTWPSAEDPAGGHFMNHVHPKKFNALIASWLNLHDADLAPLKP